MDNNSFAPFSKGKIRGQARMPLLRRQSVFREIGNNWTRGDVFPGHHSWFLFIPENRAFDFTIYLKDGEGKNGAKERSGPRSDNI